VVGFVPPCFPLSEGGTDRPRKGAQITKLPGSCVPPSVAHLCFRLEGANVQPKSPEHLRTPMMLITSTSFR